MNLKEYAVLDATALGQLVAAGDTTAADPVLRRQGCGKKNQNQPAAHVAINVAHPEFDVWGLTCLRPTSDVKRQTSNP